MTAMLFGLAMLAVLVGALLAIGRPSKRCP